MPDVPSPELSKAVEGLLYQIFPAAGRTLLDRPYLDIRRPNLHDSKSDFQYEMKSVKRSSDDLFTLYGFLIEQGEVSIAGARGIPLDFTLRATERNKSADRPKSALDLVMQNAREVDYWKFSKQFIFDLYLSFRNRLQELEGQRELYWSSFGRPPDHYARVMALRLAKLYARRSERMPTIGTASDGDHPSTEYGRFLQQLFEVLKIDTGFRLPGEWAIGQLTEADLPKPTKIVSLTTGLFPNLKGWENKSGS